MIIELNDATIGQVKNPVFARYARTYIDIYADFMRQVAQTGIEIDSDDHDAERAALIEELKRIGATFRNGGRSIYVNNISPGCVACQKGVGSATFFVSLKCHRDCYYCFNPNQVEYEYHRDHQRNLVAEFEAIKNAGQRVSHLAITGGEPLLHEDEVVAAFDYAKQNFPGTYRRLYTCGDHVDEYVLNRLSEAGLHEIRFSIRVHDLEKGHRHTFERIALAREFIPAVMVEMPILPGTNQMMEEMLVELDEVGIHSINLLEFCYPLGNAVAFNDRGFKARKRPFTTLYNYWYAGGVPVARSELTCLELMRSGIQKGLKIGMHYCSLENKLTGQNYQQNWSKPLPGAYTFSHDDYLLKAAKVFGKDVLPVIKRLRSHGYRDYQRNQRYDYLAFHVDQVPLLADMNLEVGISTATLETRDDGDYLRELKIDLTHPSGFDPLRI